MTFSSSFISFDADQHRYFDQTGNEYISVSRLLKNIQPDFQKNEISYRMAVSKAASEGMDVEQAQREILDEWEKKKNDSLDHGTRIHENIEAFLTIGSCDPDITQIAKRIARFASSYNTFYPEKILYSKVYHVAGTSDLVLLRKSPSRNKQVVVDLFDYKTNLIKGITYDSIKRDEKGRFEKQYDRYLLDPVSHLEHCNYNLYSLQLSMYGLMAEMSFPVRVGRLGIIFIDPSGNMIKVIPVAYLRRDVMAIMEQFCNSQKD